MPGNQVAASLEPGPQSCAQPCAASPRLLGRTPGALSLFPKTRTAASSGHNEHCSLQVSGPALIPAGREVAARYLGPDAPRQMGQPGLLGGGGKGALSLTPSPPQGLGRTGPGTMEASRIWPLTAFPALLPTALGYPTFLAHLYLGNPSSCLKAASGTTLLWNHP